MSLNLATIAPALERSEQGIWTSRNAGARAIRFPEGGHSECFDLEDRSFWFAHRNDCIAAALRRHPFDGSFLDVGGGNGIVSVRLERDGLETVMLEPGPDGATNARTRGLPNVVCATLEDAAFRAGSFGGAGAFDVIEHVEDDAAMLSEMRAVLALGGVLAVTVPAYAWLWSAEDETAGHCRRYTLGGLRRVVEEAGFEVRYATYFFAPLVPPVFLLRSLRHRRGAGARTEGAVAAQHVPRPNARRAMDVLLRPEREAIRRGTAIPFGTSCLLVARAR